MSRPASTISTATTAAAANVDLQKNTKKENEDSVVVQKPSKQVMIGFVALPNVILDLIFNGTHVDYNPEIGNQSLQFASTHELSYDQKIVDGFNVSYPEIGETVVMNAENEPKLKALIKTSHHFLSIYKSTEV